MMPDLDRYAGTVLGAYGVTIGLLLCLVLASWEFNSFLKTYPEVALELLPIVVKRFRETNDALVGLKALKN